MSEYFGNNVYTPGGTRTNRNVIYGSKFTLSHNGKVIPKSIFVYSESGSTNNWKCAIYDSNFDLVAETEQRLIGSGTWYEFEITTADAELTGTADFYLMSWSDNNQDGGYNATVWESGIGVSQALTFGSFPSTLTPAGHDRKVSIYCIYDKVVVRRPRKVQTVALYTPMNEGQGNPHDSSGYGNNGTISGSAIWGNGSHGRHLEFKGWTDKGYVDHGNASILQPTEQFAVACWIRPAANQEYCFAIDHGNYGIAGSCDQPETGTTTWSWQLRYGSEAVNCSLGLQVNTAAGSKWAKLDYALVADQWKWILATFTPTDVKIYVDAVLKGSDNYAATTINTNANNKIFIGVAGWGSSGTYYEGDVADFKFFTVPPTTTEATSYFNGMKGRFGL